MNMFLKPLVESANDLYHNGKNELTSHYKLEIKMTHMYIILAESEFHIVKPQNLRYKNL